MAELGIPKRELDAIAVLNSVGVKYLLIGGYAKRFHGLRGRETDDVDLFVSNSRENAERIFTAIARIVGHSPTHFGSEELQQEGKHLSFKKDGVALDVLTSQEGLEFSAAYLERIPSLEQGVIIQVISKQHLLHVMKNAAKDATRAKKETREIDLLESI